MRQLILPRYSVFIIVVAFIFATGTPLATVQSFRNQGIFGPVILFYLSRCLPS